MDLARGIAMLSMVATHVSWLVLHTENNYMRYPAESFGIYLMFAISAYLLARKEPDGLISMKLFIRRSKFLLGYLLGFSALFCIIKSVNPIDFCLERFYAYWFFVVLWLCMALSEGVAYLAAQLKKRFPPIKNRANLEPKLDVILWLFIWAVHFQWDLFIKVLPIDDLKLYFPCFVAGRMLVFNPEWKCYILNKWSVVACFLFWVAAWIMYPDFWDGVYYLTGFAGAAWVWWLCDRFRKLKALNFVAVIGKETLWIYGLHFYFLLLIGHFTTFIPAAYMNPWWIQWLISPLLAVFVSILSVVSANLIRNLYNSLHIRA